MEKINKKEALEQNILLAATPTRYKDEFFFYVNDKIIGYSLELYGEYSQKEVDFLTALLTEDTIVYDVGANIGYHSVAFASKKSKVFSFEPQPMSYKLLEMNTENMNNVQLFNIALGNTNGEIYVSEYDPTKKENYGTSFVTTEETSIQVPIKKLDDLDIPLPDVIKMDVEGYEYDVLLGCENKIKEKNPIIFYEAHETKQFAEIYNFLNKFDYRFYWAKVDNYNVNNFKKNAQNVFGVSALFSIVAWPKSLPEIKTLVEVSGPEDSFVRFCLPKK